MTEQQSTVLIATESTAFGNLLSRRLGIEQDIEILGIAADGVELAHMCDTTQPDVILLNFGLEEPNLVENIKIVSPASQVVFIVQDVTSETARMAMRVGARDCLCSGSLF